MTPVTTKHLKEGEGREREENEIELGYRSC